MDKLKVRSHIKDDDLKIKMYKVVDICNSVSKNYGVRNTDFLNPYEIRNAISFDEVLVMSKKNKLKVRINKFV